MFWSLIFYCAPCRKKRHFSSPADVLVNAKDRIMRVTSENEALAKEVAALRSAVKSQVLEKAPSSSSFVDRRESHVAAGSREGWAFKMGP
jgi:hypothetical protein